MDEIQRLEARVAELEGQVEALTHSLITLVNLAGTETRDRIIQINDRIRGRVIISSLEATEAFEVALSRINDDLLEPLVTVGDLD